MEKAILIFALADDSLPAAYLANWMLGKQSDSVSHVPTTYYSTKHRTEIGVPKCTQFLVANLNTDTYAEMSFFTNHSEALKLIAAGEQKVWTSDNVSITSFQSYVKKN